MMKSTTRIALLAGIALAAAASALAGGHRSTAPEAAEVYFISPEDGATVSSPVSVKFGLSGMGVAPAGIGKEGTGHHHLLIDTELENYDEAVPSDDSHRHFGGGQTETSVELTPGEHTLQLIVGDQNHVPHDPPVQSEVITITVQ